MFALNVKYDGRFVALAPQYELHVTQTQALLSGNSYRALNVVCVRRLMKWSQVQVSINSIHTSY